MYGIIGIATALFLLVAVWAGLSRRYWFLRAAAGCVVLLALYPIRAFEPMAWLMLAIPLTACLSYIIRWRCAVRPVAQQDRRSVPVFQFRLIDFFLAIVLAGVISALCAALWREQVTLDWRVGGVVLCCVVFTELCLAVVLTNGFWRVLATSSLLIAMGLASALYASVLHDSTVGRLLSHQDDFGGHLVEGMILFICLSVVIMFTLSLVWTAAHRPKNENRGQLLMRGLGRIILCSAALLILVPMLLLYVRMVEGRSFPVQQYSEPNSYPKIQAAIEEAVRLNPSEMSIRDVKRASGSAKVAIRLEELYSEVLPVLKVPGHVAIDYENITRRAYLEEIEPNSPRPRHLSRMLQAESEDAAADGRFDEAAQFALASMQLGNTLSRGGVCRDTSTGIAIEGIGSYGIVKIRKELSSTDVETVLDALQRIDQSREPFAVTAAREAAFRDQNYNWIPRLQIALASFVGVDYQTPATRTAADAVQRRDATLQLLIANLAIRLYREKYGRFPNDFEQLVPGFLKSVPVDPFSGNPVIYRQTNEGPVIYCVGVDGMDDGGRFGPREVVRRSGFDYDLDVITRFGS